MCDWVEWAVWAEWWNPSPPLPMGGGGAMTCVTRGQPHHSHQPNELALLPNSNFHNARLLLSLQNRDLKTQRKHCRCCGRPLITREKGSGDWIRFTAASHQWSHKIHQIADSDAVCLTMTLKPWFLRGCILAGHSLIGCYWELCWDESFINPLPEKVRELKYSKRFLFYTKLTVQLLLQC